MALTLCRYELAAWNAVFQKRAKKMINPPPEQKVFCLSVFPHFARRSCVVCGVQQPVPPLALWASAACSALYVCPLLLR
jgi:hypothetical protein